MGLDRLQGRSERFYGFGPVWKRFRRRHLATFGALCLCVLTVISLAAPWIAPYSPYETFAREDGRIGHAIWQPPSSRNILGTDGLGRDVLSRLIYGGRVSLIVGLSTAIIATTIGLLVGSVAGFFGGWIDTVLMRATDTVICFPVMFLVITVSTLLRPSIFNVVLVMGLVYWTTTCRLVRAEFLRLRQMEYAESARAVGVDSCRMIARHLLPNAMSPVLVAATLCIAWAILTEAALSFLGVGVQQPIASWGNMLNEATKISVLAGRPLMWLAPGIAIMLTVLSINFIGDGLRDALDPRLHI